MIEKERLKNVVSVKFVKTKKKALEMLNKCYTKRIIRKHGILAIKIKVIS